MYKLIASLSLLLGLSVNTHAEVKPTEQDKGVKVEHNNSKVLVDRLLSKMTLAEKIGQMTQAERKHASPEDVKKYFLGSILNGGGSVPGDNTAQDWRKMIDAYQQAATSTRLGIPIIYGTDAVHGHNNVTGATLFPHNIGLGAMRDPQLMQRIGAATAEEVVATGVHWNFAPALCVARDIRWGRSYECYAEHPEVGASYSGPYVKGLQGSGKLLATAKHWVGDGGVTYGTGDHGYVMDRGDTRISEALLNELHILPYLNAFDADVGSVMISYSSVNGLKMHEHKALNTQVLKGQLNYEGFLISDWQAIEEVAGDTNRERVVKAINSGLDMAMEPEFWKEYIRDLTAAVEQGEVEMSRIDDAVRRILRAKVRLDLFKQPMSDDRVKQFEGVLGSDKNRELARKAVAKSMVLLKNQQILPLNSKQKIFVAGQHGDDIGLQSGGWSIEWQGKPGDITAGTSILEGIKQYAPHVTYSQDGKGAEGHDVAIVVIGELPHAEGYGDYDEKPCEFCQPLTISAKQQAILEQVQATGVPMLVISVSGRPLLLGKNLDNWQAFLAAWLPGTEGGGVADVLFAKVKPQGKLPVTWPRDMSQIQLKVGDENYTPLFPYGFGLSY